MAKNKSPAPESNVRSALGDYPVIFSGRSHSIKEYNYQASDRLNEEDQLTINRGGGILGVDRGGGILGVNRGGGILGVNRGGGILGIDHDEMALLKSNIHRVGLGYIPDIGDARDKILGSKSKPHQETSNLLLHKEARNKKNLTSHLSSYLKDPKKEPQLSRYSLGDEFRFTQVEDQEYYNSCTANAVIGAIEFLVLNDYKNPEYLDLSRMFLYGRTRRLLGFVGDSGAYIRSTIKAMRLFGALPESEWPYNEAYFDAEPDAFHFAYAQSFKCLEYARLDGDGRSGTEVLNLIKKVSVIGFPVVFGFPVYSSINKMKRNEWLIPVPDLDDPAETLIGGHAVMCIGYDDDIDEGGALIIRNSWGESWGDKGYAYLPYEYIHQGLAMDFWVILHQDYAPQAKFFEKLT